MIEEDLKILCEKRWLDNSGKREELLARLSAERVSG